MVTQKRDTPLWHPWRGRYSRNECTWEFSCFQYHSITNFVYRTFAERNQAHNIEVIQHPGRGISLQKVLCCFFLGQVSSDLTNHTKWEMYLVISFILLEKILFIRKKDVFGNNTNWFLSSGTRLHFREMLILLQRLHGCRSQGNASYFVPLFL